MSHCSTIDVLPPAAEGELCWPLRHRCGDSGTKAEFLCWTPEPVFVAMLLCTGNEVVNSTTRKPGYQSFNPVKVITDYLRMF